VVDPQRNIINDLERSKPLRQAAQFNGRHSASSCGTSMQGEIGSPSEMLPTFDVYVYYPHITRAV
jgi:hypothetical protein